MNQTQPGVSTDSSTLHTLKEQLLTLSKIQELDLKILKIENEKNALPQKLKETDLKISTLTKTLEIQNKKREDLDKNLKQSKAALDLNNDRMERSSKRVEEVQNTNEFQAVSKEIEQLKKLNESLSTQLTGIEAEKSKIDAVITEKNAEIQQLENEKNAQLSENSGVETTLNTELEKLLGERKELTSGVQKSTLLKYDRVRSARAGVGLSAAVGGRCTSCNLGVPPQMFNELHKGQDLHSCPSCQRLLFIP